MFQYRGVLAYRCLSICMSTPTVRLQKNQVASECVSRILFLHLHVPSKAGHATLKSHKTKKCIFIRTRSINLFQYRGVLAYQCLSMCISAPTVGYKKSPKGPFSPQRAPVGGSKQASVSQEICFCTCMLPAKQVMQL